MKDRPPFDDEARRLTLLQKLNQIPGIDIPADAITKRPVIPLSVLTDKSSLEAFINIYDWVIKEINSN